VDGVSGANAEQRGVGAAKLLQADDGDAEAAGDPLRTLV